jgi:hypothetical protein
MTKILICGFENAGTGVLFSILKRCTRNAAFADQGVSILDLVRRSEHIVSECARDIFVARSLIERGQELRNDIRVICMMRDPRFLIAQMLPDETNYFQGFDHTFNIRDDGFLSFSNPGVLHTERVLSKTVKKLPVTTAIRYEDLQEAPEETLHKVARFTGLTLDTDKLESTFQEHAIGRHATTEDEPQSPVLRQLDLHGPRIARQFRLAPALFDPLKRWGYASDRGWFEQLSASASEAFDDTPGVIVAYFTQGTGYETEVRRLEASVRKLDIPLELKPVPDAGSWLANVRLKPGILLEARKRLRGPLLYVDADAIVHTNPWPYLRGYAGDVAVSTEHAKNVVSGTILLNDTEAAQRFLELWKQAQEDDLAAWDQHALHNVVTDNRRRPYAPPIRIQYLPPAMCHVFDRKHKVPIIPVIEHLQASREMRAPGGSEQDLDRLQRRRKRLAEIEVELNPPSRKGEQPHSSAAPLTRFEQMPRQNRSALTSQNITERRSDVMRWSLSDNLKANWAARAELAAKLIWDEQTIIDLGCGAMQLEPYLSKESKYIPLDLVTRDSRTVVCDLNGDSLPDIQADLATMLGVLEYIHNPDRLLSQIAAKWPRLILSYNPADLDKERDRKAHGWFNSLASATVVQMGLNAGFTLDALLPFGSNQRIYKFSRQ